MVMTKEQSANIVSRLFATNNRIADKIHINAWHDEIKHIDYDLAVRAAKICMANETEQPNFATFLRYVEIVLGSEVPDLTEATNEVRNAIHWKGRDAWPIAFSHEAIAQAIGDDKGWRDLCNDTEQDWVWKFQRAYKNISLRVTRDERKGLTSPKANEMLDGLTKRFELGDGRETDEGDEGDDGDSIAV